MVTGVKHLYLVDFDPTNLPNLKETIESKYPDAKATTFQADASDEAAISAICNQALEEEGRLDVFFANVGSQLLVLCYESHIHVGRHRIHEISLPNNRRELYEYRQNQLTLVRSTVYLSQNLVFIIALDAFWRSSMVPPL